MRGRGARTVGRTLGRTLGRLTKRPEFLAAAAGRRFHTERMTLQGRLRDTDAQDDVGLRFGFTVTKKVGHATERNRIKRRLRAAAYEAGASHADTPADVVVVGRRGALSATYGVLVADIDRALGVVTRPKAETATPGPATAEAAGQGAARRSSPLSTGDSGRDPPHA
jgi:ribonuclease P protein component